MDIGSKTYLPRPFSPENGVFAEDLSIKQLHEQ
jgi:hypothetical protein